jgi:two-component system sensor histidine kinase AlgZ
LFRASLSDIRQRFTLKQELELCQRYLEIELLRLGEERLQVIWDTDRLPGDALIPALTLQPLLENAIYHGIELLTEGGVIEISGRLNNKQIEISLSNPLPRSGADNHQKGNQIAQDNIRERLQAYFIRHADLTVSQQDHSYKVTLSFPYKTHYDEDTDR